MERFNDKTLNAYDYLAYYYDLLLSDDESLSIWLKEIESEPFKTVLELASGTGTMAAILKEKGYDVIASDISESMKEASKANFNGEYKIINMINYDLNQKYDLVLCICDSINYLNEDELDSFFKCAKNHLNPNGRLIFDMHHLDRLKEFEEEYIEEGNIEGLNYQWTINADNFLKTVNEHFAFYTKDGLIQEMHSQNVFEPQMVIDKMHKYFEDVKYIEDFIPSEKVLLIGK